MTKQYCIAKAELVEDFGGYRDSLLKEFKEAERAYKRTKFRFYIPKVPNKTIGILLRDACEKLSKEKFREGERHLYNYEVGELLANIELYKAYLETRTAEGYSFKYSDYTVLKYDTGDLVLVATDLLHSFPELTKDAKVNDNFNVYITENADYFFRDFLEVKFKIAYIDENGKKKITDFQTDLINPTNKEIEINDTALALGLRYICELSENPTLVSTETNNGLSGKKVIEEVKTHNPYKVLENYVKFATKTLEETSHTNIYEFDNCINLLLNGLETNDKVEFALEELRKVLKSKNLEIKDSIDYNSDLAIRLATPSKTTVLGKIRHILEV